MLEADYLIISFGSAPIKKCLLLHNNFKTYRLIFFTNYIMEYNSSRNKLIIPEYGRNIQKMIDYTVSIEDETKRSSAARAIINIMSQVKPNIKDSNDYKRTLWDHMYIISKFQLVVDSPYPPPSQEVLTKKPEKIVYGDKKIRYRHYGKNIEGIIEKAIAFAPRTTNMTFANGLFPGS